MNAIIIFKNITRATAALTKNRLGRAKSLHPLYRGVEGGGAGTRVRKASPPVVTITLWSSSLFLLVSYLLDFQTYLHVLFLTLFEMGLAWLPPLGSLRGLCPNPSQSCTQAVAADVMALFQIAPVGIGVKQPDVFQAHRCVTLFLERHYDN